VKRGDILERIARRHNTTVKNLQKLNHLKSRNRIYAGQRLKISPAYSIPASKPESTSLYVVKRKDTLGKIAHRHHITVGTLLKLNDMKLKDRIYVSQKLKIPSVAIQEPKSRIYIVKRGDTIEKIARTNRTSTGILINLNNLKQRDRIYVNQKLKIQ
jgi:peptidoglycan endopeptidase LytE